MTEIPLGAVVFVGALVLAILFLFWSLVQSRLGAMMSTALVADCAMGMTGTLFCLFIEYRTGATFVAASVVGFCVISAALWIRPTTAAPQAANLANDSQPKAM